ncbi:MFS transporter [Photorhabdus temperata]|uniref:Dipeptide/tripeptide permease n=1 Tax=Photorhabdus temperata subsp. temperata Meg1 TaxID=1393735 RepID=A0A081RW93_PHOTE|nr:MFS transporter [Photorhabdus temperata]KER02946.1 dipeptide/tripeptide permease [Photorhabdus temperata subsp. temperata Meg1]MCT8347729.1 MFS transporter [Photorhabdus temperata]
MQQVIFNKKILPLSLSSLISKTGDFAHDVVFAIITIELLSSNFIHIGVVYFFRFIPYLFFGPVGGWLADVFPKKNNMIFSDTLRFTITFILFITYISDELNIYILIFCSMLMTVGRSLFQPSFRAYLPEMLEKKYLPKGNSLFQIIEDLASIIGPLACSLIIALSSKAYVLLMDCVSYLLSVFLLFFLRRNEPKIREKFSLMTIFYDTKNSIISMRRNNQNLFMVIIGTSICVLFTAALLRYILPASIINIYKKEELVGYVFSIVALGTVLGGICYTRLIANSTPVQLMKSWMIYGLLFLVISLIIKFSLVGTIIFAFFLGFSGAIVDISIITNIQSLSAENEIGKNYGLYSTIANTCESVSGVASGIFSLVSGGISFSIMALFIAMSAKIVIYKLRRINHEQDK